MSEFKNKVVVVTGGNSGIGEAIAKKFNQLGARVVIFGRDQKKLDAVVKQELPGAIAVQGDVKRIADLDKLFATTEHEFGKIDVLIANAGVSSRRIIDEVDEKFFDEIVDTNYKGVYFTVQRAVSRLNLGASVILISSAACHNGWHSHSVYSSAKAAVSMLARNFSADLIGRGIRVNAISPGMTETPIFDTWRQSNPNITEELAKEIPMKRFADPSEIASAAAYLSSKEGSFIVGIDLVIDGGINSIRHWQCL